MNEADDQLSTLIHAKLLHQPHWNKPDELDPDEVTELPKEVVFTFGTEGDTPSVRDICFILFVKLFIGLIMQFSFLVKK